LPLPKIIDLQSLISRDEIRVFVGGEVEIPQLVAVPKGTTLVDIENYIKLKPSADKSRLASTHVVKHMEYIFIPKQEFSSLVSINYGTAKELENLPGIGPTLALKIIEYRETYGFFQSLEALMLVPGIKQGKYDALKAFITR